MDRNLTSYVKVYDRLDADFCAKAVEELRAASWHKHAYHNPTTGENTTYDTDLNVSWEQFSCRQQIMDAIWGCLQSYMQDCGTPWFHTWNGFSGVRFNKYEVGQEMKLHCDHIHSMFEGGQSGVPTLSILGALNNDYEGGELIFWEDEVMPLPAGSIMVFPSNFLYPHEVRKVKTGDRFSFVSWAY